MDDTQFLLDTIMAKRPKVLSTDDVCLLEHLFDGRIFELLKAEAIRFSKD